MSTPTKPMKGGRNAGGASGRDPALARRRGAGAGAAGEEAARDPRTQSRRRRARRAPHALRGARGPPRRRGDRDAAASPALRTNAGAARCRRPPPAGRAAPGDDLALVVEGDRHRAHLWSRVGAPDRAWHRLLDRGRGRRRGGAAAHAARPHDRVACSTTTMPPRVVDLAPMFARAQPRPLVGGRARRRRRGGAGARQPRDGPGAGARRDRLPARSLPHARPRSDRRRADDVRAGQQRALPPQDLQRRVRHRRRAAGGVAVPDDPPQHRGVTRRRAVGVSRQRGGHRGLARRAPLSRSRDRRLSIRARAGPYIDEGRDPQPPDGDLALSRAPPPVRAARSATRGRPAAAPSPRPACAGSRSRTCACRARCARGSTTTASRIGSCRRSTSCSRGRSAPRRSTTSSAARTCAATSARWRSRRPARRVTRCAATTSRSWSRAAWATSAPSTCRRARSRPARRSSCSADPRCSSVSVAARRRRWRRARRTKISISRRSSATTPRCSAAARK